MSWNVQLPQTALGLGETQKPITVNIPADASTRSSSSAPIYPDHWWGDDFWRYVRAAGRYDNAIAAIRLPEPPDPAKTRKELDDLLSLQSASDYSQRLREIIEENEGPPAYYHRMLFSDEKRNSQTGALLVRSIVWSLPFIMHFKCQWKRPRPSQLEPRLRPAVDCPPHPAYPSGHSTQAHLVALVMGEVTGRSDINDALWDAGHRIAQNREYAGIHYKSDSECGIVLAQQLLPLFVREYKSLIDKARDEEWK